MEAGPLERVISGVTFEGPQVSRLECLRNLFVGMCVANRIRTDPSLNQGTREPIRTRQNPCTAGRKLHEGG